MTSVSAQASAGIGRVFKNLPLVLDKLKYIQVVQKGRKVKVNIVKTEKKGWGKQWPYFRFELLIDPTYTRCLCGGDNGPWDIPRYILWGIDHGGNWRVPKVCVYRTHWVPSLTMSNT